MSQKMPEWLIPILSRSRIRPFPQQHPLTLKSFREDTLWNIFSVMEEEEVIDSQVLQMDLKETQTEHDDREDVIGKMKLENDELKSKLDVAWVGAILEPGN